MARLNGKVAIVTGAARGIGEAIAQAFVAEGAHVWLTDIRDDQGLEAAGKIGGSAVYKHLDVREEGDWRGVTDAIVKAHGRLDILVNNAAIIGLEGDLGPNDPENASIETWRAVHRTNLEGVFLGCKYAIGTMRRTGSGSIINISSRSGIVGQPAVAAYASSKAGVRNHTKSVALWCASEGLNIRCNSIHPATVMTPMWDPMLGSGPDRQEKIAATVINTPLRRFGEVEEIAAVAVMLASDEAPYMTGSELIVDGGILAGSAGSPRVAK